MSKIQEIGETGFVTSTYRATNERLSKDIYAKLWTNEKTDKWIEDYLASVSTAEPFVHCLRHRYFLDKLTEFTNNGRIEVLINFGCGFSMYPFLLKKGLTNIEIDKSEIIEYKKARVTEAQIKGELPQREVHYLSSDLENANMAKLCSDIRSIKKNKPSFILIEGVLFFLTRENTSQLFNLFQNIQHEGGLIGSVSFQKSIEETKSFQKMIRFYQVNVMENHNFQYQTLPDCFYHNLKHYQLIDHQDYYSLSKRYRPSKKLDKQNNVLNENMYLLRKNNI